MKGSVLFIYRGKMGTCSAMTIYRKLHGHTQVRTTKTKFGEAALKSYHYPGIPHRDVISGVFFAAAGDEAEVTEFFEKNKVPYLKIRPGKVGVSNWDTGGQRSVT